jgi:hypothetical protein
VPERESNHQAWILRTVRQRGGIAIPTTRLAPVFRGIPDIMVCYRGRFVAIEVKGERTPWKKLQRLWHRKLEKAGALVIVAKGHAGRELVDQMLDMLDEEHVELGVERGAIIE